jgi:hypothetical protein
VTARSSSRTSPEPGVGGNRGEKDNDRLGGSAIARLPEGEGGRDQDDRRDGDERVDRHVAAPPQRDAACHRQPREEIPGNEARVDHPLVVKVDAVIEVQLSDRDPGRRRGLLRAALVAGGLGVVLWIPTVLDVLLHEGSNARLIVDWFRHSDLAAHSLIDGSKVVLGQFGLPPEWLTSKRLATVWGESAFLYASPPPVLLVPVALAAWTLWWRCRPDGPRLVLTLGLALLVSVGAVARTPGPVLDYRLRSTWMPAMVAFVVTAWAGWAVIAGRSPRAERRWLVPGALVALAGLGALNTATVAVDVPHEGGSAAVRSLTSQLGQALAEDDDLARRDGAVVVARPPGQADSITAALVLQLERQGIDAKVPTADASAVGRHRVLTDGPVKARLVVASDQAVLPAAAQPGRRLVAWWSSDQLERDVSGPRRDRSDGPSAAGGGGHEWLAEQFSDEALRRRVAEDDVPSGLMLFAGDAPPAHQIAVFLEEP